MLQAHGNDAMADRGAAPINWLDALFRAPSVDSSRSCVVGAVSAVFSRSYGTQKVSAAGGLSPVKLSGMQLAFSIEHGNTPAMLNSAYHRPRTMHNGTPLNQLFRLRKT